MMRLEFVMILIRKGAIGVYSVAMLTLQGAQSQLKICADQTACPRHARLSLEPPLLQRDGQAQGLLLPPNRLQRSRGAPPNTLHPEIWFKAQLRPLAARYGGQPATKQPHKRNLSIHNQRSVRKCHTPI